MQSIQISYIKKKLFILHNNYFPTNRLDLKFKSSILKCVLSKLYILRKKISVPVKYGSCHTRRIHSVYRKLLYIFFDYIHRMFSDCIIFQHCFREIFIMPSKLDTPLKPAQKTLSIRAHRQS